MNLNTNIDVQLGSKLRQVRKNRRLSQKFLAEALGASQQLVQRYESGQTRMNPAVLFELSTILNIDISTFFENIKKDEVRPNSFANDNILNTKRYRPLNIYLIDDEPEFGILVKDSIAECNKPSNIISINRSVDAVPTLHKAHNTLEAADIIIMDINMPEIDGITLSNIIKKDRMLMHIPIIICSGTSLPKDMERAYANKASSFFQKPSDLASLSSIMDQIVRYWSSVVLPTMQYE